MRRSPRRITAGRILQLHPSALPGPDKGATFVSIRRLVVSFFAAGALAVPASAMAQDPIVQGYGGNGPTVENQITPPGQVEAQVVSSPKKQTPTTTTTPQES